MFVESKNPTQQLVPSHFPQAGVLQLQESGLIALLPGDVPLQERLSVIDALLAAPVLVTVVQYVDLVSWELLSELRQQTGRLMLVGVVFGSELDSQELAKALRQASDVGAQFAIVPFAYAHLCWQQAIPHLPLVGDLKEATAAVAYGYSLLFAYLTPMQLAHWRPYLPTAYVIAAHDAAVSHIPLYIQHQATAVAVPLWGGVGYTMRALISRARQITAAWQKHYISPLT